EDMEGISFTLNSLGVAYSRWGETQTAIEYFRRALEVEAPLNRPMQYAIRLASLAKEYMTLGEYEEALSFIQEALSYDEKITRKEREERIALHLTVLGDIYVEMDSLSQASRCYDQAIGTFISNKQNNRLAEIYFSMGKLSIKQKNFERAIDLLEQSVAISEVLQMRQLLYDSYRLLYEVSREKQSATQTLIYLERYKVLGDSLFQEATREDLAEFRVRYDTQQKELEIVRQQAEIDKHRNRQYLYIGGLVIAGVLLVLFIYIIRLRNKRNRALAEINATKDKFFSIISHDLKNPAIAQRDALQQLITYAGKWEADSLAQYYEELLKSADGQVELLYNLLNWAQVQTGRMPYVPTEFDLVAELRSDIALIKNMAERKGIVLETRMPESAVITGDRNMLVTVVRNLLTNAVKFTDKGGRITLEIKPDEEDGYTISVADTGRGMRREEVEGLFRIDRQRSRMGTAGEPGSGLGLIVCKELVEKHGGMLRVESEVGKGSEFLFAVRKERN
ncbi:hypothetical protein LJC43_03190, partial [Parabacteroides sp. OttesenSCG-928-G21]|nr:hypothetical protein [Parabacteroides sp. OttesenSCG-928-G21]